MTPSRSTADLVKNSTTVSVLTMLGVVSTLLVDLAIAAYFGTQPQADAFFIASTIPNIIVGSLLVTVQVILVPIIVNMLHEHPAASAYSMASAVINVGTLLWLVIAAVAIGLAPLVMPLLAWGASDWVKAQAVVLSQALFLMLPFTWLAESLKAGLNAHYRFTLAAAMTLVGNLAALLIIGLTVGRVGIGSITLGYLTRTIVPIPILLIAYRASGARYVLTLGQRYAATLRAAFRLFALRLGAILARESDTLLERFLASFLPSGSIAALAYAQRAAVGLESVLAGGVSVVIMPDLAHLSATQQKAEQQRLLTTSVKMLLLVTLPIVGMSIALSAPLTALLFGRGQFDAAAVQLTAALLSLYLIGLPFSALVRVIFTAFYAGRDARTPAVHMLIMLAVNTILLLVLFPALGIYTIPLAASLTYAVSLGRSFWLLQRNHLALSRMGGLLAKMLAATLVASVVAVQLYSLADPASLSTILNALWLAIAGGSAMLLYLVLLWGLGVAEIRRLTALVWQRTTGSIKSSR
jgi:putative peptidoglycan lipid II flippase